MAGLHDIQKEMSCDWVRRRYLKDLADYTKRDTIIYAAGWGPKPAAQLPAATIMIMPDDMQGFMASMHGLHGKELDLILHSGGGSSEAAEQIVSYLRAKYDHIRVFVPQRAMSAATMIACAADVIVMGKESALGPIDPQIALSQGPSVPAQSILDDFSQAQEAVSKDPKLAALFAPKLLSLPHGMLSYCQSAINRSQFLVGEWLMKYMKLDKQVASAAAAWLGSHKEHWSHGRPISADRLIAQGLKIEMLEADNVLQDKVLSVYHAIMWTFVSTECVKMIESNEKPGIYMRVQIQPMMAPPMPAPRPAAPAPLPGAKPPPGSASPLPPPTPPAPPAAPGAGK
jgi:hypothetical protein